MVKRIYLSPPTYYFNDSFKLSKGELSYSDIYEDVNSFEKSVKEYLETDKLCLALNSGTSAIHIALILAGVTSGDYVLCQSHTFIACANAIRYQGAIPVFIDSEKVTWNIDKQYLENAVKDLNSKNISPKVLIATSLYGMPFEFDDVYAFAKDNDIKVIEDSAEALGSSYKNRKCGTLADYGILSFNYNKIITSGGGGILVCKNEEDYFRGLKIATQAKDVSEHYHHSEIGYNYRMGHLNAKIGVAQMDVLEQHIKSRRQLNIWYRDLFKNIEGVELHSEKSNSYISNHWLSVILVDPLKSGGITKENLRIALEKNNIESRPLWKPMHLQPLYNYYPYYGEDVSENLFLKGLCLPSGSLLKYEDKKRIENVIFNVFN
ncbi:DegT/DnrJ/EryC1/StrS family aminotransferase [Dokdonia sp. Hel_I_53]|uniref:DegT/DnrJ/EryC1/StrS family aminotransferase n=1 Tax=Dokdonia sp. Hel_I_53 TaxID=1566287 RepID=UPI00119BA020|nr:aminotransferase class I/II-fold pyridoxal phosphate-dependent enzyme [Dokdonia sp. Hel_I_53]TVZ51353.1 dTDP-4-amino-4,6-dideoxygalactose transaminase [Dokdonia sp. Hel_I_53]